jgi:hypothetical protein
MAPQMVNEMANETSSETREPESAEPMLDARAVGACRLRLREHLRA